MNTEINLQEIYQRGFHDGAKSRGPEILELIDQLERAEAVIARFMAVAMDVDTKYLGRVPLP